MADIKIDPEFKDLIPALLDDEFKQLEANIIRDKRALVPLIIWNGLLLDGHNRFEICTRLSLPFQTTALEFEDRESAMDWIVTNQLGRRNLTKQQMDYLRGKKYEFAKKRLGGLGGNRFTKKVEVGQNDQPLKTETPTAVKIAKEIGVGEATVRRAGVFSRAVDELTKVGGTKVKNEILSGKVRISHSAAPAVKRMSESEKKEVVDKITTGVTKSVEQAIREVAPQTIHDTRTNDRHIEKQKAVVAQSQFKKSLTPVVWKRIVSLVEELRKEASFPDFQVSILDVKKLSRELHELVSSVNV